MRNVLSHALTSCLTGRKKDGKEKPLQRSFTIAKDWDWEQPSWCLDLEHCSPGFTQGVQLVVLGRALFFGVPRTSGSDEINWIVAPCTVVVRRGSFIEFFATIKKPEWKDGVSFKVLFFGDSKELELIEYDPADRARLLSVLGSMFPPVT